MVTLTTCRKEKQQSLSDFIIGTWNAVVPNEYPIYKEITFTDSTYQLTIVTTMNGNDTTVNDPVGYEINGNILIMENLAIYDPPDIVLEVPDQPIFIVVWDEMILDTMTWKVDNEPNENVVRGDIVWLRK